MLARLIPRGDGGNASTASVIVLRARGRHDQPRGGGGRRRVPRQEFRRLEQMGVRRSAGGPGRRPGPAAAVAAACPRERIPGCDGAAQRAVPHPHPGLPAAHGGGRRRRRGAAASAAARRPALPHPGGSRRLTGQRRHRVPVGRVGPETAGGWSPRRGRQRLEADPVGTHELVELCGRLPLAIPDRRSGPSWYAPIQARAGLWPSSRIRTGVTGRTIGDRDAGHERGRTGGSSGGEAFRRASVIPGPDIERRAARRHRLDVNQANPAGGGPRGRGPAARRRRPVPVPPAGGVHRGTARRGRAGSGPPGRAQPDGRLPAWSGPAAGEMLDPVGDHDGSRYRTAGGRGCYGCPSCRPGVVPERTSRRGGPGRTNCTGTPTVRGRRPWGKMFSLECWPPRLGRTGGQRDESASSPRSDVRVGPDAASDALIGWPRRERPVGNPGRTPTVVEG